MRTRLHMRTIIWVQRYKKIPTYASIWGIILLFSSFCIKICIYTIKSAGDFSPRSVVPKKRKERLPPRKVYKKRASPYWERLKSCCAGALHRRRRLRPSSALTFPSYMYQNHVLVGSTRGGYAFPTECTTLALIGGPEGTGWLTDVNPLGVGRRKRRPPPSSTRLSWSSYHRRDPSARGRLAGQP